MFSLKLVRLGNTLKLKLVRVPLRPLFDRSMCVMELRLLQKMPVQLQTFGVLKRAQEERLVDTNKESFHRISASASVIVAADMYDLIDRGLRTEYFSGNLFRNDDRIGIHQCAV